MNYKKIYDNLIFKAQNRILDKNIYTENHHVIPICIDKTKRLDKNNIIKLLAKEHFIAHFLLFKIYPDNKKLLSAFLLMYNCKKYKNKINNKLYEKLKLDFSKWISEINKGKKLSNQTKEKMRQRMKGNKYSLGIYPSKETSLKRSLALSGKNHPMYGKNHTKKSKKKMSESHKKYLSTIIHPMLGKHHTKETRQKMSETRKKLPSNFEGHHHSEKTKLKISIAKTGRKLTEEHKEKDRQAILLWWENRRQIQFRRSN